jgi:chorismate mutase
MNPGADPRIAELRAAIDASDDAILQAVERRIEAVRALHDHKQATGTPLADPGRETEIRNRLRAQAPELSEAAVAQLVTAVLQVTRQEVARLRGQDWSS